MIKQTDNKILSVPQQVFDRFLKELEAQKVPEEVVAHLKKILEKTLPMPCGYRR